jgi:hypothetical protein
MKHVAALALVLSSCSQQAADQAPNQANSNAVAGKAPAPTAKRFSVELKTDLMEFDFSWPAEAAAVPDLVKRLRAEMDKAKAELIAGAKAEKTYRAKQGLEYHPHSSSTGYETSGQSPRLLSLRVDAGGYTGGAHGNYGTAALLWDRQGRREIRFVDLFVQAGNRDRLLTQRWCDALNKAREEKRGEPVGGGMFDDCPTLDDIAVIPVDSNKDGRFDKLQLVASPYVAGPYAEGSYEIELAVTGDLVAGLKAEYQPSFAAQRPQ